MSTPIEVKELISFKRGETYLCKIDRSNMHADQMVDLLRTMGEIQLASGCVIFIAWLTNVNQLEFVYRTLQTVIEEETHGNTN